MANSLQEQLLKMGLVDDSQVRKAQHEKRVDNQSKGRKGVAAQRTQRDSKASAARQATKRADRAREKAKWSAAEAREVQQRAQQIVDSGRVQGRVHGRKRFYFESRDGRVPYVELSDEIVTQLERGRAGLAETPTGETSLIEAASAERVFDLDPDWLRVWNG